MKKYQPKVVNSDYSISVNGAVLHRNIASLKEARLRVKEINLHQDIENIQIVKETTTQTVINNYAPKVEQVVTVQELFTE